MTACKDAGMTEFVYYDEENNDIYIYHRSPYAILKLAKILGFKLIYLGEL